MIFIIFKHSTKWKTTLFVNSETFILHLQAQHYCSLYCVSPEGLWRGARRKTLTLWRCCKRQHFAAIVRKTELFYSKAAIFAIFSKTSTTIILFLKWDHIQLPELYILKKYRKIDMDFTIFGNSAKYKIGALIINFSTLKSIIFCIFINVSHQNIASVFLFQNIGNKKTIIIKLLVLVLQKLSLLAGFFLSWLFLYEK